MRICVAITIPADATNTMNTPAAHVVKNLRRRSRGSSVPEVLISDAILSTPSSGARHCDRRDLRVALMLPDQAAAEDRVDRRHHEQRHQRGRDQTGDHGAPERW